MEGERRRRGWYRVRGALLAAIAVALVVGLTAPPATAGGRVRLVASFYPLAWVAREVGAGTPVRVTDLTPGGAEPHDLELTTDDRDLIEDADLVVVLGGGFQPAVEEAAAQRDGPTFELVAELPGSARRRARRDPHVWLDPVTMRRVTKLVRRALRRVMPDETSALAEGARATRASLARLHDDYRAGLADCERDLLVTAHEAFGWLARRYDLHEEGIAGVDPEAEPDPRRLAELADLARAQDVTTIFSEELVSPEVAETLAREAGGLRTAVLSPLESLTEEQRTDGDDYLAVMRANLEELRRGLGCP